MNAWTLIARHRSSLMLVTVPVIRSFPCSGTNAGLIESRVTRSGSSPSSAVTCATAEVERAVVDKVASAAAGDPIRRAGVTVAATATRAGSKEDR